MRGGFYFRLAVTGILKNRKFYFPYILTCICMIMMFYIIAYLGIGADMKDLRGGEMMQGFLNVGIYIIAVFALIFLYYTNSFLIRRRKREFGLYNILGMGKRNLVKLIVCESLIHAVVSLAGGLLAGILLSKLAELAAVKILEGQTGFAIHIALKPVLLTVALFIGIFFLIMLRMLISVCRLRPVEMLKSENTGEKPPKANWIFAFAGAVILAASYYLAVAIIDPVSAFALFFVVVVMVIVATYMLFISGSVALCRLLQKNKRYYYKTKHFVSVSSMAYRMKRNGAGLASICILSTMVLVTVSSTVCMYIQTEDEVQARYPYDIMLTMASSDKNETLPYRKAIDEVLADYGEKAEKVNDFNILSTAAFQSGNEIWLDQQSFAPTGGDAVESVRKLYFITLDDYNALSGEKTELKENEIMLYPKKMDYTYDTLTLDGCGTWNVRLLKKEPYIVGPVQVNMEGSMLMVVKDMSVLKNIEAVLHQERQDGGVNSYIYIEENYEFDLACDDDRQIEIFRSIADKINKVKEQRENMPDFLIDSKVLGRQDYIAINGGMFYLGVLLGAVFLFGTVLIMYYKQISEGYEDQERFDILMKVGMTEKEVRQSINSQVLTVFFLPLATAGIHLAFAFPMISKILMLISSTEERILISVTVCCYLVFALFYIIVYAISSKNYYMVVRGKEK